MALIEAKSTNNFAKEIRRLAVTQWRKHLKPRRALGLIENVAFRLAEVRRKISPALKRSRLLLFVGDHGIAFQGVSAMEPGATAHLLDRIAAGGTAANIFCRHFGIELKTFDVGSRYEGKLPDTINDCRVGFGTSDISVEPAMTSEQRDLAIEHGKRAVYRAVEEGIDLCGVGEIGIGNTSVAASLTSALLGLKPEKTVDRGTGISKQQMQLKRGLVDKALKLHIKMLTDPLNCLRAIGGFEFAGIVGAILACSETRTPVVIDGFATSVSALIASRLSPSVSEVLFFSHITRERGQRYILEAFKQKPLFNLKMALGEGTGAAIGMDLVLLSSQLLADID